MTTSQVTFTSKKGFTLFGNIEWSHDTSAPFALIAHCFTCSKQSHGALRLARKLNENGFNVLRFDFTGIGSSQGELNDSDFAANIDDIIAAADYLREHHHPVSILIGHSLGGAAVLAASQKLSYIRAIVSIASPYDPGSIAKYLHPQKSTEQNSLISIGEKTFPVDDHFLASFKRSDQEEILRHLPCPLLVVHARDDEIIPIEDAMKIFNQAGSMKSFVMLDGANHLLTHRADTDYLGTLIAAWSSRYIDIPEKKQMQSDQLEKAQHDEVIIQSTSESLMQQIQAGPNKIVSDEPISLGGSDQGLSPYELLLASLGSCTSMTLQMYARHKKWPLTGVKVKLKHKKVTKETASTEKVDKIEREIFVQGELDEKQRLRLKEIADRCPIHRSLAKGPIVETKLAP